jgi:hypothetical protein
MGMDRHKHGREPELTALVKRMGSLFARGHAGNGERLEWSEIEELLTDGYALALALEAERARVYKQIFELECAGGELALEPREAGRLRSLGADYAVIERDIRWLRSLLEELHAYGRRFKTPVEGPTLDTRPAGNGASIDEKGGRTTPV